MSNMMLDPIIAALAVFFSPKGGCEAAIIKEIGQAHQSVQIQAYSFTSQPIEAACEAAKARGAAVTVILDKSWQTESPKVAAALKAAGVPVLIDSKHAIAHAKIIIIDLKTVIDGSFNFTEQAEHQNSEILHVIKNNPSVVSKIVANFALHLAHSTPMP